MAAIWQTQQNLGAVAENQYYNLNFSVYDTTGGVTYTLVSGSLPNGLSLASNGNLSGNLSTITNPNNSVTSNFTVRATDSLSAISDRTFTLEVITAVPPNITPNSSSLGTVFDGTYYSTNFSLSNTTHLSDTTFSIDSGNVPNVVVMSTTGNLAGYIDRYTSNVDYNFTVKALNGSLIDTNSYNLTVIAHATLTADSDVYTADNVGIITSDLSNLHNPVLLAANGVIGSLYRNKIFAQQLQARDFDGDDLSYAIVSGSLPPGLTLTTNSGWITGTVSGDPSSTDINYSFEAKAYKTSSTEFESNVKNYTLTLIGQSSDEITWTTESNLGIIYTGEISELQVYANSRSGGSLNYTLVGNGIGGLPPGLDLLADGAISGRPTFNISSNVSYTFTIRAQNREGTVFKDKEFAVTLVKRDNRPYENVYITLLPTREGRDTFNTLLSNTDIIPSTYLYRQWDTWFGTNRDRKILFASGLNPDTAEEYINAIQLNHYWKTLKFGNIKTAVAKDDNLNPIYEVVYADVIDQQVNSSGFGPNLSESVPTNSANISTVYPNSFPNMVERLAGNVATSVGYENRGILPKWMTTQQTDGNVLGFTRSLVLAYVLPGRSQEVSYRINQSSVDLKNIDFTIDRYEWDSILSNNFIKSDQAVTGTGNITANTISNIVTGNGTAFSSELVGNATLYVSNVAIGNVVSVTDNTTLIMDANSTSDIANLSFTYSNIFRMNNYVTVTGNITTNTSSNIVTGISSNIAGTGTISGNSGSQTITGNSTTFTTEARVGANLYVSGNSIGQIKSITSANVLTLLLPLTSTITSASYTVEGQQTLFVTQLHIGDTLVNISNTVIGTIATIANNTSLTLTANAAIILSDEQYRTTASDPVTTPDDGNKYLKFPQIGVI